MSKSTIDNVKTMVGAPPLSKKRNIIGFDLMEHSSTNPKKSHYSDFSAAKLIHKVLCIIWKEKVKQQ